MPFGLGFFATAGAGAGGAAFELISTQVLSTTAATVTFSSIPATYKHLQVRMATRANNAAGQIVVEMRINADSGSNYARHELEGNGSIVGSNAGTSNTGIRVGLTTAANATTNSYGVMILDLLDYANTSKNTTVRSLSGYEHSSSRLIRLSSGLWLNTAAVNQITFFESNESGSFVAGSRFSLYGVRG